MTIVIPNNGEGLVLNNFLNKVAPQNQTLKLFANNITPAETDTVATYTEAAGGGYASKALTGASWTVTEGAPSDAAAAEQVFTFTGPLTTNLTVYGYFFIQTTSLIIMWSERDSSPFAPTNNGDQIKLTPTITAD